MRSLKLLRGNKSQKMVADRIGISQRTYSNYEIGARQPDFDILKRLADYFNVSIDYLLDYNPASSDAFKDTKNKLINALGNRNISVQDLNKLTQDDINMLLSLLEKFIKEKE